MFKINSKYKPSGDQPRAIKQLVNGIKNGKKHQTLLGVTGSGKTFTIANVIEQVQKPTIVMAHNKTLAGQLYSEFKELFPNNSVEYFISYFDYFQPEAYIVSTDTYIEKDSSVNDEIDRLRHSATAALFERKDVIIIASVSAIYSLGDPEQYSNLTLSIREGMEKPRDEVLQKLVELQYERNDIEFVRGKFRVKGDIVDVFPAGIDEHAVRIEFFGDEIDKISYIHPVTGKTIARIKHDLIYPKSHYVTSKEFVDVAIEKIKKELEERLEELRKEDKIVEAYRLEQRVNFDIEMLQETGFCQGIENYSIYLSDRERGSSPYTLFDYLGDDFLVVVDESHATIPQIGAMYNGDRARKTTLVEHGFRLPSALDNRPLKFEEWENKAKQVIYVSATPGNYELNISNEIAEQIIRPTGLIDPEIIVKPTDGQIEDLINNINRIVENKERVLVTTLTKKMSEELTSYLEGKGIKVRYMHSDIKALERLDILRDLRIGKFDVLVGINLLREGLDLPEVALVAILDADKEGFLRSERSLIQTIGRAARNSKGKVIMYADELTNSMEKAIKETNRRRKIQKEYNEKNGIVPASIKKDVRESIKATFTDEEVNVDVKTGETVEEMIDRLTEEMFSYAKKYEFEKAAMIRDLIKDLKES
ncbi:MAG: excinuclease ABC subunit UvrB [Clostridia bacterium]|nr:excinuclease ABC subunit UvrB [Clostridia bacterium]MDD4375419.1 excinuclease ABC subunit UvrB [Clostridia bacterium]